MNGQKHIIRIILRSLIALGIALIAGSQSFAQVITNQGAVINVRPGTYVESKDVENNAGSTIENDGNINLTGNYTSIATTNGNTGFFRIGGNWTNTGGVFVPGSSTVIFNGAENQLITRTGGETFFNLSVANTGGASGKYVSLSDNVDVIGTLSMSVGNVDAGTYVLYLANNLAASLNYTSTTGSRILGRFERGVGETGNFLFPLGTTTHYNPAHLITNNIISSGSVLSQFFSANPGSGGLPLPDPPVEIFEAFPGGFWRLTANSFSSTDFNVNLDASGFLYSGTTPDTVWDVTRVIKRTNGGNWITDGTHANASGTVVYRNNLTGDLSAMGTEFALGRQRPLIITHPVTPVIQCEKTDAVFTVVATGAAPLTYRWFKDGVIITNVAGKYTGARTATLTVQNLTLADAGTYWVEVTDKYHQVTVSNTSTLTVNKIPVATITPSQLDHECSNISFDNLVTGETYGVPGTWYIWTRTDHDSIVTALPLSGSLMNIGDFITGTFNNISDNPITVTFTIVPVGPSPTFCVGNPVTAKVTVNPTPRAVPVNSFKRICYGGTTQIKLTTPTKMTQGVIQFDYTVTTTSGTIAGDISAENNRDINYTIARTYQNNSDTIQSVFYHITPKNMISGCNSGPVVVPQVKVHPKPLQNMYISVPFTCAGASAGTITTVLSKATKPDELHWSRPWRPDTTYYTSANTNDLKIHFAGVYKVTVKDSMGCQTVSNNLFVSGAVFSTSVYVKPTDTGYGTSCRDSSDGEIWIWEETSSTAVPPYEFWLVKDGADTVGHAVIPATGYANRVEIKSLKAGHYLLFMKDANGCYNGDYPTADIVDPDPIDVQLDKKKFNNGYNLSCLNYSDGKAWVKSASGGNGSYSYKWSTVDGLITPPDNTDTIKPIPAGTYYLRTTDMHNCSMMDTVRILAPPGIVMTDSVVSLSPDGKFNIACSGYNSGSIGITVTGGSGNYDFLWTGPGTFTSTLKDISDLPAGIYTAKITDKMQPTCIMIPLPTFDLSEPSPLVIGYVRSSSFSGGFNINCHGGTGSINVSVTGGSQPYTYNWTTSDGSGIDQGKEDQNALKAGTYRLVVTDANNCSATVDIKLTEPNALAATLKPTNITCAAPLLDNGAADLTVNGGVLPYGYNWVRLGGGFSAGTEDISGLTQGYYKVTVTDANNCRLSDSVNLKQPAPVLYTKSMSRNMHNGYDVSCYGMSDGAIDITTTSGQAPFTYNWQKAGGGYSAVTEDISGLKAGQYTLLITDANSCIATETIDVTEPGKLSVGFKVSHSITGDFNINCAGESTGTIDALPVNHVKNVKYLWSDGDTLKSRTDLKAGDYSVIITDANGCRATGDTTLTQPDTMRLSFQISQPWCPDMADGAVLLTAQGGIMGTDYTYKWSDNATSRDIYNIGTGLYKVTVTDLNGCSVRDSVVVDARREICLIIPNAISPNGDLINDVWNIGLINLYPQVEIKIFNRWGEIVWRSEKGYPQPWDGRSNGRALPIDSYHYIIDLNNGSKPIIGNVTIVR